MKTTFSLLKKQQQKLNYADVMQSHETQHYRLNYISFISYVCIKYMCDNKIPNQRIANIFPMIRYFFFGGIHISINENFVDRHQKGKNTEASTKNVIINVNLFKFQEKIFLNVISTNT